MILVERTHWPLVVVGSVPDVPSDGGGAPAADDVRSWTGDDLLIVLIVAGVGACARASHQALFEWLCRHQVALSVRTLRFAWVIEDDTLRGCAEAWQALLGNAVLGVDSATFCSLRPALRWLLSDSAQAPRPLQWEMERVSFGGWFDTDLPARGHQLLDGDPPIWSTSSP